MQITAKSLTVLGQGPSHYIPLEDIPQVMQDAILAMEDRWFYKHPGFNPIAILRAFYINFKAGRRVAGRQHHHPAAGKEFIPDL